MTRMAMAGVSGLVLAMALVVGSGCDSDSDLTGGEIYITPGSYSFHSDQDTVVTLRVIGAKPPFVWHLSDASLGTLTGVTAGEGTTVDAANYVRTPKQYGRNTVLVTDARGWQASSVMSVAERLDEPVITNKAFAVTN